ncbi:MAG: aminoacyl-tRNA hydrolase [Verrucomicrobia bacterium]|nr:aminoacyl-tRNA hydrolase [Verrucomicrobiota bacterium]
MLKWMKSLWSSQNARAANTRLIVGLGNPGSAYEATRHNIGFRVVRHLASQKGLKWREKSRWSAETAMEDSLVLLLPLTYMNCSGESVRKCLKDLGLSPEQMLVVCDDVALDFGQLRIREGGSSGGHNGLKNIEAHLGSQKYPRLRIGVGSHKGHNLADYVLGKFSAAEEAEMPKVLEKASSALSLWLEEGTLKAMNQFNVKGDKTE